MWKVTTAESEAEEDGKGYALLFISCNNSFLNITVQVFIIKYMHLRCTINYTNHNSCLQIKHILFFPAQHGLGICGLFSTHRIVGVV